MPLSLRLDTNELEGVKLTSPNKITKRQSLKAKGKHHLTAVGAVSRKLYNIIFTILGENRPYEASPPKKSIHSEHVRKATPADLPEVVSLFKKAIHSMNDNGIYQWDDIYPNEKTLKSDIVSDSLYLYTIDEQPASAFVLNQICDSEYSDGNWKYPLSSYAVVHRLCVNPAFQHMGIGTRTMLQVEILAKSVGIESIRLDAFSLNPAALRLYEKLGYAKTGVVTFRKGLFYLFEKKL